MSLSYEEALKKMQHYCAYQDRCHKEVRNKLYELEIYGEWMENIIVALIEEKFLDEMRYASSFVGGKFRIKQWGRIKITQKLKFNRVSSYCIKKALEEEISEEDYQDTLYKVIRYKNKITKEANAYIKKQKIAKYVMGRGFESYLVWPAVHEIVDESQKKSS